MYLLRPTFGGAVTDRKFKTFICLWPPPPPSPWRDRADEGARDAFVEGVELLAEGKPVGAHVALVRQVHDRRRWRPASR
jgi:hypothetical protein